jgi:hypothetical protein
VLTMTVLGESGGLFGHKELWLDCFRGAFFQCVSQRKDSHRVGCNIKVVTAATEAFFFK